MGTIEHSETILGTRRRPSGDDVLRIARETNELRLASVVIPRLIERSVIDFAGGGTGCQGGTLPQLGPSAKVAKTTAGLALPKIYEFGVRSVGRQQQHPPGRPGG